MPKVTQTPQEQSTSPMSEQLEGVLMQAGPTSMMVIGVNRKINTGNFENIDVYAGISVPVTADVENLEAFKEAAAVAAEVGFAIASKETGERYNKIKDAQSGGRK